jgi:hypothetical protein
MFRPVLYIALAAAALTLAAQSAHAQGNIPEKMCQQIGDASYATADARDKGVPELAIVHVAQQRLPEQMQYPMLQIVDEIYSDPEWAGLDPVTVRARVVHLCRLQ